MNSIYDLIELIGNRTAMYTGECKLSNVRAYIDGYSHAIEKADFLGNFPGFHNWVAEKYGFRESTAGWLAGWLAGWHDMILAVVNGILVVVSNGKGVQFSTK